MQTVLPICATHQAAMGAQKIDQSKKYKWITCCTEAPVDEGTLLCNFFTKELLFISREEREAVMADADFLISHWFMIPESTDERRMYTQFKELLGLLTKPMPKNAYTVLTTTACNARCSYCYEAGREKTSMTPECADKVVQYIVKTKTAEKVNLLWFGGEPLFNSKVIDRICKELKEKGVAFQSTMTSNGYLFDDATIDKATKLWGLRSVQITLDGTQDAYNAAKAYIYKNTNAFQTVIGNIEHLLAAGVHVKIRLNMGLANYDDLCKLCLFLKDKFAGVTGIVVYPAMLYESSQNGAHTDADKAELHKKYFALQDLIDSLGLGGSEAASSGYKLEHCQADNDHAVCIAPDGSLTECQHFTDEEIVGDIASGLTNTALKNEWKELLPKGEECKGCKFYIDCIRLKKCPVLKPCTEYERLMLEYKTARKIKNTYAKYKKEHGLEE